MRPNGTNNLPWTWQRVFPWKRKGRGTACVAEILYGKRERPVVSSCSVKIGRSASRVLTSGNLLILASCLRKLSKCRELRLKVYIYIPWTNRMYVCVKFFDSNGRRNFDNWYYFSINSIDYCSEEKNSLKYDFSHLTWNDIYRYEKYTKNDITRWNNTGFFENGISRRVQAGATWD